MVRGFAARGELGAADYTQCELHRHVDSVRLERVSSNRIDARGFVGRSDFVSAFAADSLASEHVAIDTAVTRLGGR